MSINHSAKSGDMIGIVFSSFSNMKVCCVFSLESPHRGVSYEYTQHTIINIKTQSPKIIPDRIMSADMGLYLLGTQEQVRISRGKRPVSVQTTEVKFYCIIKTET